MGRHIIIRNLPQGGHERLRGVFSDAQFDSLPWVKGYGAFPAGYAAIHFGDDDAKPDPVRDRALSLPQASEHARPVLAALWKAARARQWAVVMTGWGTTRFATERAANACLRAIANAWRRNHQHRGIDRCCRFCHRYGGGRYTAIRYVVEGRLAFELKVKHRYRAHAYVQRIDLRTITITPPLAA